MQAKGRAFKYGDNVDTDVIIPARYLNSSDPAELATHCMEDIDNTFVKRVQKGDIIVATKNFAAVLPVNMRRSLLRQLVSAVLSQRHLPEFFTEMQSTLDFRSLSARKQARALMRGMR